MRIKALLNYFGNSKIALENSQIWPEIIKKKVKHQEVDKAWLKTEQEIKKINDLGFQIISIEDEIYPSTLKSIYDPPPILWLRGENLDFLQGNQPRTVAIVGSRQAPSPARIFAARLASDLAKNEVVVISGLARGIDTEAHRAAIDSGGISVAVLGSGLDQIYPPENKKLAERLTLLSDYSLGTKPLPHNFPARNRIVAGLSSATAVISGELTSGALITANLALENGRTVFAVPGRPGEMGTAGPHRLLREGAVLLESAEDVLNEFGWSQKITKNIPKLEENEQKIYQALQEASIIDNIMISTGLNTAEINATLTILSLKGLILELPDGRYSRAS